MIVMYSNFATSELFVMKNQKIKWYWHEVKALLCCLLRLDFSGMYAIWDFNRYPENWREAKGFDDS